MTGDCVCKGNCNLDGFDFIESTTYMYIETMGTSFNIVHCDGFALVNMYEFDEYFKIIS